MNQVVIFSFSKKGYELGKKITTLYPEAVHKSEYKTVGFKVQVEEVFKQHNLLIFVGAVGIAIRGISKFIQTKDVDPAVIVVDELGQFIIPLLSGHLGGANGYAVELATFLQGTPVVTTATDINGVFAVDVWAKKEHLHIQNIDHIKYISSALLNKEKIGLVSNYHLNQIPDFVEQNSKEKEIENGILISDIYSQPFAHTLWIKPKKYVLGVGCRKNIDIPYFETQLLDFLEKHEINISLIRTIATIDLKEKEPAILEVIKKYGIEFTTFSAEELQKVEGEFQASAFVQSITGVDNVCERSSKLASGAQEIFIEKTSCGGITFAVCIKEGEIVL